MGKALDGSGRELDPDALPSYPEMPVIPDAFRRGWKRCLYSSWTPAGCCGGALTCHRLGEVIPLRTCVECLDETDRPMVKGG